MIESYWTHGQSETTVLIWWFQSGDQNGSWSLEECLNETVVFHQSSQIFRIIYAGKMDVLK